MTNPDLIRTDHGQGVVEIGLNRAPVNALSPEFLFAFADMLNGLARDEDVKSVVLTSNFKVYSAGLDLKEAFLFTRNQQDEIVRALNVGFLAQFRFPKPIIVAINGAAIAGGLFFVLASDLRVSGPRASFGLAEVQVGADFPIGPLEIARATLDPNMLRRLMLSGQPIRADEAAAKGVVDILEAASEDVVPRALKEAQKMAALPSIAFASIKQQIRGEAIARIETAMRNQADIPEDGWFNSQTKDAMKRMLG